MKKPHPVVLMARIFGVYFILTFFLSMFWNILSWIAAGTTMFPFGAVIGVSIVMTIITVCTGWTFSTVGGELLMGRDPAYRKWKEKGGRPYWDFIGWPITSPPKPAPIQELTGQPEPTYTNFVPPDDWRYQCPACGARVQHQVDVCWNCNYGADGDSTAYYQRYGSAECQDGK